MVAVSDTAVVGTKEGETLVERMLAVSVGTKDGETWVERMLALSVTAAVGTEEGETSVERMLAVSGMAAVGTKGGGELTCTRGSDTCAFTVRPLAELPLL